MTSFAFLSCLVLHRECTAAWCRSLSRIGESSDYPGAPRLPETAVQLGLGAIEWKIASEKRLAHWSETWSDSLEADVRMAMC